MRMAMILLGFPDPARTTNARGGALGAVTRPALSGGARAALAG